MMRGITLAAIVVGLGACGDNIHPPGDGDSIDTIAPAQVQAGDVIPIQCNLSTNGSGSDATVTVANDAQIDIQFEDSVLHLNGQIVAKKVGTIAVTCSLPDLGLVDPTPAMVKIVTGAPYTLVTTLSPTEIDAGDSVYASCQVFDIEGNAVTGQSPTLAISPSDPQATITGLSAQMIRAGHYDGQCTLPGVTGNAVGFDVDPNLPAHLALGKSPDAPYYPLNTSIGITSTVTDRYGNAVTGATVDLTSHATTGSGSISASPPNFSYSGEGRYEVDGAVTSATEGNQPVTATTGIVIDELGPKVLCGSPGDASMIYAAPGSTVTFSGTATDVNGTSAVAINGTPVTLNADGTFSGNLTSVFGINFVHVTATDSFDVQNTKICTFLASGTYADPNSTYAGVIGLSLSQAGVDDGNRSGAIGSLGDLLYTILNSTGLETTLNSAMLAANPLKAEGCDDSFLGACLYSSGITYLSSSDPIGGPNQVSLTLENGYVATSATVNNVNLDLNVKGAVIGVSYNLNGTVNVPQVVITLNMALGLSSGTPTVSVSNVTVTVNGSISTNFSGVAGWIVNNIIVPLAQGSLKTEVQNALKSFVQSEFASAIGGVLSGLNISSIGGSFNVPHLFGGGSVALNLGIAFSSLSTTTSRLQIGIGAKLTPNSLNSFATLGVAVAPGTILGDPNPSPGDMAVPVNVTLINQALHALWRGNWLTATVPATTIFSGAPADLSVVLNARLPPVALIQGDGTVQLSLGDLDLQLTGDGLPDNFIITVGARAHTTVSISGTTLVFGALTVDDTELSLDALGLDPSTETELESLVGSLIPTLISSSLTGALPSFPIPSFAIPSSLSSYGIPAGSSLTIASPALQSIAPWLILRGQFSIHN